MRGTLFFGSILDRDAWLWLVFIFLFFMAELLEILLDLSWQRKIHLTSLVVPVQCDTNVSFAVPLCCDCVVFFEYLI